MLAPKTCSNVSTKTKQSRAGISIIVFFYHENDPTAGRSLSIRYSSPAFIRCRNIYIYIYSRFCVEREREREREREGET